MIGYYKNGRYENIYGKPISCFKCGSNLCIGAASFTSPFGKNGVLLYCAEHHNDAKIEAERRDGNTTVLNSKISGS